MKRFDVVVVGAGTAGCLVSMTLASEGAKVCMVDRKAKEDIGRKVCGDAIGKHHYESLGLEKPKGGELEQKIVGIKVYSPNLKTVFSIRGEGLHGYVVNRHLFGQRLVEDALDSGTLLLEKTQAVKPTFKEGFLSGVVVRNVDKGEKTSLTSKVVVDASGFSAVLRKQLPMEMGVESAVKDEDVEVCFREIRRVNRQDGGGFCEIYLNQKAAPGGYAWIFPEGSMKVNVGLGVAMIPGFLNPRTQLYKHILSKPLFKDSSVVEGGAWYVPTRRPLYSMVGNGVAVVGDSACQANPIHGGGMGPSMMGGKLAGKTILEALETGDFSRGSLWPYNVGYVRSYGAKQAALDVFRAFLQGCSDEELNYGMQYRLITEDDVLKASVSGDVRLNITDKTSRVFRGLRKLGFLRKLRHAASYMRKVKTHYSNFPLRPERFREWCTKTDRLFREARF